MIDKVTYKIINEILKNEIITSHKISNNIAMSISCVKQYMPEVKKIIGNFGAILESSPGKGFVLNASKSQIKNILEYLENNRDISGDYVERRRYILNVLLSDNATYTINLFSEDIGVSKNIINNELTSLEKWLEIFDLKLIKRKNVGISIEGKEFDKRQAIISLNSQRKYNLDNRIELIKGLDLRISRTFLNYYHYTYPNCNILEFQKKITMIERETDIYLKDLSFVQLIEYLTISFIRIKNNNFISKNNKLVKYKTRNDIYIISREIMSSVITNIDNINIEAKCLAVEYALHGLYDFNLNSSDNKYYEDLAINFMSKVENIITDKKIFISSNLIMDIAEVIRKKKIYNGYQTINNEELRLDIKIQKASLYVVVLACSHDLENELGITFSENDISYITLLIDNSIDDFNDKLDLLFITTYDYNTAKYLTNKIKKHITKVNKICIRRVQIDNQENIDYKEHDLIISTVQLNKMDNILKISRRVDENDILAISELVQNKVQSKYEKIDIMDCTFNTNLILFNHNAKTKKEVLIKGCSVLEENGYVNNKFIEEIIAREEIICTNLGNGIAIPHVYKSNVINSGFCLIKLEKPILWGNRTVNLVFIISINYEEKSKMHEFFGKLYSLISNKDKINAILNANNKYEVYDLITENKVDLSKIITKKCINNSTFQE